MKNSAMPGSPSRIGGYSSHMAWEPSGRSDGPVKLSTTNLYIKGLSAETTDATLKSLCARYGNILSTKAVLDPQTFKCKGFGFVDFEDAESAKTALDSLKGMGYNVGMAKKQEQADTNVFFKNLPANFTKEELEDLVKECGAVSSVHVMKQNGRSMGVGFARMANRADCEKIIKKYNNTIMPGCSETLLVKYADLPNRQKSQQVRNLTGQELQGALTLAAGHNPYLFPGPPPQVPLSLGAPAGYPENSMAAMAMAAPGMAAQMSAINPLGAMMMPNMPVPHAAQYSSLPAASYGYLSMAPAAYPSLQAQYGAPAELQLQHAGQPTAAAAGHYYMSSAGMQQMMSGMQTTMDGMAQWQ